MTDATNTPETNVPADDLVIAKSGSLFVNFETSLGDILVKLESSAAAKTVENFIKYVESGHYDGTIFHRVIDGFMIQGGGFDKHMNQKDAPDTVMNEADNGLKNKKYSLAMARTNDPHSASSQFFINVKDNDFLNHSSPTAQGWGYAVFGEVVEGQDVVEKMRQVKTGSKGFHQDVPFEPLEIKKATTLIASDDDFIKTVYQTFLDGRGTETKPAGETETGEAT